MERQGDEGYEALRVVLQVAEFYQMVYAVLFGFDVAVEHGAVGVQAQAVGGSGDFQPLVAGDFVVADDAADSV